MSRPTNFEFLRGIVVFALFAVVMARPDVREALGVIALVGLAIYVLWPEQKNKRD